MILSFFKRWITLNLTGLFFLSYQNSSIIQQILATHSAFRKDYGEIVIPVWVGKFWEKLKVQSLLALIRKKQQEACGKKQYGKQK